MAKPSPRVVKLSDLVPDSRNANKGTLRGLAMLDDSLREDGAGRGILLDRNNNIIAGNKTIERAVDAGFEEIIVVPTDGKQLVATQRVDVDLDSPQGRRMGLRDNRVGQVDLDFDPDVLKALQDEGLDLSTMWNEDELAELLASVNGDEPKPDPGAQTDRASELQAKWQVTRGDLWQIGKHRLLCGDSTSAEDVARVMRGERADCIIADPPYGIDLETDTTDRAPTKPLPGKQRALHNHSKIEGDDRPFNRQDISIEASEEFWFGGDYYVDTLPDFGKRGAWLVWDKRQEGALDEMRGNNFELCWSKQKHKRELIRVTWVGVLGHNKSDDGDMKLHPTQKPVKVISWLIENYTSAGQIIADPFLGSGTTLAACEQTGRVGRGIEIEPKYCAVILERLAGMGLTPERVA